MKRIASLFLGLLLACSLTWGATVRTNTLDMVVSASSTSHSFSFPNAPVAGDLVFIMLSSGSTPSAVATSGTVTAMSSAYANTSDPMTVGFSVFVYTVVATSGMTGITVSYSGGDSLTGVIGSIQNGGAFSAAGFRTGAFTNAITRVSVTTLSTDEVAVGLSTAASPSVATLTPDSGNAQAEADGTNWSFYSTTPLGVAGAKTIGGLLSGNEFGWGFAVTFTDSGGGGGGGGAPKQMTTLKAG